MTSSPVVKMCKGCKTIKPTAQFQSFRDNLGRVRHKMNCLDCNGAYGRKRCTRCGTERPVTDYHMIKRAGRSNSRRNTCTPCLNASLVARRAAKRATPAELEARAEEKRVRDARAGIKVASHALATPGWTPPPSAEEMALWYADIVTKRQDNQDRARRQQELRREA